MTQSIESAGESRLIHVLFTTLSLLHNDAHIRGTFTGIKRHNNLAFTSLNIN
jgi:hypothetical protein